RDRDTARVAARPRRGAADRVACGKEPCGGAGRMSDRLVRARRNVHLVRVMLAIDLRARLQYRGDFAVWIVFGVLFQIAALVFVAVVVTHFGGIGGWSIAEVLLI